MCRGEKKKLGFLFCAILNAGFLKLCFNIIDRVTPFLAAAFPPSLEPVFDLIAGLGTEHCGGQGCPSVLRGEEQGQSLLLRGCSPAARPFKRLFGFLKLQLAEQLPSCAPDLSGVHGGFFRRCLESDPAKRGVFGCCCAPGGFLRVRCRVLRSCRCPAAPPSPRGAAPAASPLRARPEWAGASLRSHPRMHPGCSGGPLKPPWEWKEIGRVQSLSAEGNAQAELEN